MIGLYLFYLWRLDSITKYENKIWKRIKEINSKEGRKFIDQKFDIKLWGADEDDLIDVSSFIKNSNYLFHVFWYDTKMKNYYSLNKKLKKRRLATDSIKTHLLVNSDEIW